LASPCQISQVLIYYECHWTFRPYRYTLGPTISCWPSPKCNL
jgi:hypothetical protein